MLSLSARNDFVVYPIKCFVPARIGGDSDHAPSALRIGSTLTCFMRQANRTFSLSASTLIGRKRWWRCGGGGGGGGGGR